MVARKRRAKKSKKRLVQTKRAMSDLAKARRLLKIIEKSDVPLGESAPIFAELKVKIEKGNALTVEEYEHLLRLVQIAKKWDRDVEDSARTEPEATMAG